MGARDSLGALARGLGRLVGIKPIDPTMSAKLEKIGANQSSSTEEGTQRFLARARGIKWDEEQRKAATRGAEISEQQQAVNRDLERQIREREERRNKQGGGSTGENAA